MSNIDAETPPAFEPTTIELVARTDSKITDVSIYTTRAEITRLFEVAVKAGHNNVHIKGLPNVLEEESLRVKGRGEATIHDVSISRQSRIHIQASQSPEMTVLLRKKDRLEKALDRARSSLSALHTYLDSLTAEHVDASKLGEIIRRCEEEAERSDDRVLQFEEEIKQAEKDITAQQTSDNSKGEQSRLGVNVAVGIFSDAEGTVEIALIYAVSGASWTPAYDIRVDMQEKEKPISLTYKAGLTQDTGEDWNDVPITLETASPTFGLSIPRLNPWNLYMHVRLAPTAYAMPQRAMSRSAPMAPPQMAVNYIDEISTEAFIPAMDVQETSVSPKGGVNASFKVMGLTSVPSGGDIKNVTIARLELGAQMSWVVVPKKDTRVRLSAKVVNASEYTLLSGTASVYMDGSFISKSDVPTVSPAESFTCPLGLDPAIRVTYHPLTRNLTQSGFYNKTSTHAFIQRISVVNTKTTAIGNVKVVDQFPVSQDATITVKIQAPGLNNSAIKDTSGPAAGKEVNGNANSGGNANGVAKVGGVVAMWEPEDEHAGTGETEAAGKDGRFCWMCELPAQGKVGLVMQWEVGAPVKTNVIGL